MNKTSYCIPACFIWMIFAAYSCSPPESHGTHTSLFKRSDSLQVTEIMSDIGDIYHEVGHHGPAIENEFFALRLYFNNSGAIDVYSKSSLELELPETQWYPDSLMQKTGYGSDQYKVGKTVGLGGIKLWYGDTIVDPIATKGRRASVSQDGNCAIMELVAYGVPNGDKLVDIKTKVTLCAGERLATVEASSLNGENVQFVTGINFHEAQEFVRKENYALAWGPHPEDVAIEQLEIGAAFIYDPSRFTQNILLEKQWIVVSLPCTKITSHITTVSERDPEINTLIKLEDFLEER